MKKILPFLKFFLLVSFFSLLVNSYISYHYYSLASPNPLPPKWKFSVHTYTYINEIDSIFYATGILFSAILLIISIFKYLLNIKNNKKKVIIFKNVKKYFLILIILFIVRHLYVFLS